MVLSLEESQFIEEQEKAMRMAQLDSDGTKYNMMQQSMNFQEQERSMIKDQLDLSEEIDTIEHLLKGDILKERTDGGRSWVAPNDPEMIILTDHGRYLIMNTILFYINKNTLLSNYDDETINKKMEDFSNDLTDTIFMEYEKVFKYPSFEECKDVLMDRINKKTELRKFALNLVGKEGNEKEIKRGFIDQIENRIDTEIQKIKEQIIKNKLKRFLIIIREIQDSIHSTYLRAYQGQERKTLRQHIHVSENINPQSVPQRQSKMGIFGGGRG